MKARRPLSKRVMLSTGPTGEEEEEEQEQEEEGTGGWRSVT